MREIRPLRAMWRALETGLRQVLTGTKGESRIQAKMVYGLPRQCSTLPLIYSGVFWLHSDFVYGSNTNCQNNDWATGIVAVSSNEQEPTVD